MDKTQAKITKIAREVNRAAIKIMKADGIGTSEFDLIHAVRKHDGITQAELSKILGTDKAAIARQVQRLLKKGYLVKSDNPKDKRSSLVRPTGKAQQLKVSKRQVESTYYSYLLEALTEEEQDVFCSLLDKLYHRSKEESLNGFPHIQERVEKEKSENE